MGIYERRQDSEMSAPSGRGSGGSSKAAHDVVVDLSDSVVNSRTRIDRVERLEPERHDAGGVERVVPKDV